MNAAAEIFAISKYERITKEMMKDAEKTVGKLIDKASFAQICYIDDEGYPVTRAMLPPRERDGIKMFMFTTNTSSNKVRAYRNNSKASIYFVNPGSFTGVNLVGTMEVLETHEAKARIWRMGDRMYYPKGVDDPDYCVLKFTAERGSYYSNLNPRSFIVE